MIIGHHSGTCYRAWYSAPTVMHGIFWMVIGYTLVHATTPWYSAPTVMHGIFWMVIGHSGLVHFTAVFSHHTVMYGIYIYIYSVYYKYFWVTPACVWCCDASTLFTDSENYQTSNLNMKYCTPENTIKGSVQITGRHSQPTGNDHKQELRPPQCQLVVLFHH